VPTLQARWTVRIIRFATRSLGVRFVVALGLSALVWSGLTLERNPNAVELFDENIPVDGVNLRPSFVLASSLESVRVSVRGPKVNISRLTVRDFSARVDLGALGPGTHQVPVVVQVSDPAIEIVRTTPETVRVSVDPLTVSAVPVLVQVQRAPAEGFRADLAAIASDPPEALVSGAATKVKEVATVVAKVGLEGSTRMVTIQTLLAPVDRQGVEVAGVRVDPQTAQVTVPVSRITSRKRVPVVAQITGEPAAGFLLRRIAVVPTTIEVSGQPEALERVEAVLTQPLDVTGVRADFTRQLGFTRPADVTIEIEDGLARVTVVIEPLEDTVSLQAAVVSTNLGTGLQAATDPPAVQVLVAGPSEVLSQLRGGDVLAEVDLANRGPGLHQIRPVITLPQGLRVTQVAPPIVNVRIAAIGGTAPTPGVILGPGGVVPTPTPTPKPSVTPTLSPTITPRG